MALLRLDIEPHDPPSARKIARAVEVLHAGGVMTYPTDTVYGIACAVDSRSGVERIYRAKGMSEKQRLAFVCPDLASAAIYAHFGQSAYKLARSIFPGPYTLVVPASREVPRTLLDRKRRQVGIRIPAHPVAMALVKALGRPIVTTSAIGTYGDPLGDPETVVEVYGRYADVAIDSGPCATEPSTVLEVDDEGAIAVVRQGLGPLEGIVDLS